MYVCVCVCVYVCVCLCVCVSVRVFNKQSLVFQNILWSHFYSSFIPVLVFIS